MLGNCGVRFHISDDWKTQQQMSDTDNTVLNSYFPLLFGEEAGFVFEILPEHVDVVLKLFQQAHINAYIIGIVLNEFF